MTPDIDGHSILARLAPPITSTPAQHPNLRQRLILPPDILKGESGLPSPLTVVKSTDNEIRKFPLMQKEGELEKNEGPVRPTDLPPLMKHEQDLPSPVKKIDLYVCSPLKDVSNVQVNGAAKKSTNAEEETCNSWVLHKWGNGDRETYVDKVEQITNERFHRQQQGLTGSFLGSGKYSVYCSVYFIIYHTSIIMWLRYLQN